MERVDGNFSLLSLSVSSSHLLSQGKLELNDDLVSSLLEDVHKISHQLQDLKVTPATRSQNSRNASIEAQDPQPEHSKLQEEGQWADLLRELSLFADDDMTGAPPLAKIVEEPDVDGDLLDESYHEEPETEAPEDLLDAFDYLKKKQEEKVVLPSANGGINLVLPPD